MNVPEAWASWPLIKDHKWGSFVTATFPWEVSRDRADKLWRLAMNELAKRCMSARKARGEGLPWIRSIESHDNGSAHIHALISGVDPAMIKQIWGEVVSPKALIKIEPFDARKRGIAYLVKDGDVDLSRYFQAT